MPFVRLSPCAGVRQASKWEDFPHLRCAISIDCDEEVISLAGRFQHSKREISDALLARRLERARKIFEAHAVEAFIS